MKANHKPVKVPLLSLVPKKGPAPRRDVVVVVGLLLAILAVALMLCVVVPGEVEGATKAECWTVEVEGESVSVEIAYERRGECVRATFATVMQVCEKERGASRAGCYETAPAQIRCAPCKVPAGPKTTL